VEKHIFVVDDDHNISELVQLYFEKEGYKVSVYNNGRDAILALKHHAPTLMVLDVMMPIMDGYEVLKEVRRMSKMPVIMLTAKGETFDKVLGLELGADDYVVKPFEPKELLARVKAVLRRSLDDDDQADITILPNITIDMSQFLVIYHGETLQLPPKELELLNHLVKHPNRVFTREQLLDQIWGFDYYGDTRTVDVHIKRLREKFSGEDPWEIKTVWGVGYKFTK
jgi:DNA-binding response OmpR family regulator